MQASRTLGSHGFRWTCLRRHNSSAEETITNSLRFQCATRSAEARQGLCRVRGRSDRAQEPMEKAAPNAVQGNRTRPDRGRWGRACLCGRRADAPTLSGSRPDSLCRAAHSGPAVLITAGRWLRRGDPSIPTSGETSLGLPKSPAPRSAFAPGDATGAPNCIDCRRVEVAS